LATATDTKKSTEDIGGLVTCKLKVDGKVISESFDIISINIHQEINVITRATIVLADGDPSSEDFKISSSNQFLPGKKIEISLGYEKESISTFNGIIISNSQKVNNDCALLTLECKHETIKMTLDKNSTHHENSSATDIAGNLFHKYDLKNTKVTSAEIKHKQLVQFNNSDWDFMISKLDAANLMCILNNDEIIIRKMKADPGEDELVELVYGEDIIEFDGDLDARTQSEKVEVLSWNFTEQKVERSQGEGNSKPEDDEDSASGKLGKGQATTILASGKKESKEQQSLADNKVIRKALSKIKGKVKFFGRVSKPVLPGDFIKLKGLGKNFNGNIFVSAINHEYNEGDWIITATVGWDDKFFAEQVSPAHETSSSGELSTMQGLQIGIITDIIDSDGDFRVKLRLPIVDEKQEGVFARIATLDAGNNRGTFFMPEINDEVVVGFMNNDPNQPVVLGMLHSSKNAAPLSPEKANNKKGYVSRSEIKILIDDGEKSITIETPGGNIFCMNDTNKIISVTDLTGNKITMETNGVTIESKSELNIKAATAISITAPKVTVKGDAEVNVEGATANLSGSASMNVKGGIVKIN
jgi:Rhs element Vgr protein